MRIANAVTGIIFVAIFLFTGRYMSTGFPELYAGNEVVRMMFRANHIYILLAALPNLALFLARPPSDAWMRWPHRLALLLVMLAPAVLTLAFFFEAPRGDYKRILTLLGIISALAGSLLAFGLGALGEWSARRDGLLPSDSGRG